MNYNNMSQQERDNLLQERLPEEKVQFLKKYALHCAPDLRWFTDKNNSPQRYYFSQRFLDKNNILAIVFRKYQLCSAKLKYFSEHLDKFDYVKHDPKQGFVITALWDIEFFQHKETRKLVDLRYLQQITDINEFLDFIDWLGKSPSSV